VGIRIAHVATMQYSLELSNAKNMEDVTINEIR